MLSTAKNWRPVLICKTDNSFIWGRTEHLNKETESKGPSAEPTPFIRQESPSFRNRRQKNKQINNHTHTKPQASSQLEYSSQKLFLNGSVKEMTVKYVYDLLVSRPAARPCKYQLSHQWILDIFTWMSPQACTRSQSDRSQHRWNFLIQTAIIWNTSNPQSIHEQSLPRTISSQ